MTNKETLCPDLLSGVEYDGVEAGSGGFGSGAREDLDDSRDVAFQSRVLVNNPRQYVVSNLQIQEKWDDNWIKGY